MNGIIEKWHLNIPIIAAISSWVIAQTIKLIVLVIKDKKFDFHIYLSTGGMPSAHSAIVSGLTTSIGLYYGFGSALFAISCIFAFIVMFDAQSVRRAVGMQARILNKMMDEFFKDKKLASGRFKELLGHTSFQVIIGMFVGIFTALFIYLIF